MLLLIKFNCINIDSSDSIIIRWGLFFLHVYHLHLFKTLSNFLCKNISAERLDQQFGQFLKDISRYCHKYEEQTNNSSFSQL